MRNQTIPKGRVWLFCQWNYCGIIKNMSESYEESATIRPTLIDRITVKNCVTGETAEIKRDVQDEIDWLMDDLVFQMEQMYNREGSCAETDDHLYELEYYMNDKLEIRVYINSDGSVCKNGVRFVQAQQDDNVHPIDPAAYEEMFELNLDS